MKSLSTPFVVALLTNSVNLQKQVYMIYGWHLRLIFVPLLNRNIEIVTLRDQKLDYYAILENKIL